MTVTKKKIPKLNIAKLEKIASEIITAGELSAQLSWNQVISKLQDFGAKIEVAGDFHGQVAQIDVLLANDKTGIVNTIFEYMVASASVPFTYVTDNKKLTEIFNDWSKNQLNKNVAIDIPVGQLELSSQYNRERLRSGFLVLNIVWDKINGYHLPSRMYFSNGGAVTVKADTNSINGKSYWIGETELKNTEKKSYIIRKPYNLWHEKYPTPYLVKKGVLFNALLKMAVVSKQGEILEEIIPYLLLLRGGDKDLLNKNMLGDLEKHLIDLKNTLKEAKKNKKNRSGQGDSILKARYDMQLEHFFPDLTKIFDTKIVKPINNDMLFGLGLVELEGFSSTRTEAILNPKVLIEEIIDSANDLGLLYEDVNRLIIEKNKSIHPKLTNKTIRLEPGVIKGILTDNMRKLIKDYSNTGQLSIEDSFEALPTGFNFETSKMRRKQEQKEGLEELFFPRPILNQNSDDQFGMPRQNVTPNEVPQEASVEYIQAPYEKNKDLPDSVKVLSAKAQTIFRKTFNDAIKNNNEETSFKISWSKVKEQYKKKQICKMGFEK